MIAFFVRHPNAANLLMLGLAVLGLTAAPQLRRETFPEFSAQFITVTVVYPGASADAVEEAVVQRIEDAVSGIKNIVETTSVAREGAGIVTLEVADGADISMVMADVKSEVEGITDMPPDTEKPVIQNPGFTSRVAMLAVTGPMPPTALKTYCEELKRRLRRHPQINLIDIRGFSTRQLQIRLRAGVVGQYGFSARELADVVAAQSIDMPVGKVETRDGEILLRVSEERRSVAELEDLVVLSAAHGGEVRLGEIAEIRDGFENSSRKTSYNGKRAGLIIITKTEDQDILTVMSAIEEQLAEIRATAPPGVEIAVVNEQASVVEDRLSLLLDNGSQGLLLVFLALWLFFGLRLSVWVAAGLPLSFLGALFVMNLIGYSLNMMTMMALLMALGLLMDDAIVLAENVASHRRMGKSSVQAAIDGVGEVKWGVLSSFLTTAAIFVPLAILEGTIGKVLMVIPVVLLAVMSVSLIEAFLILPNHLGHIGADKAGRFRRWFDSGFERIREKRIGAAVDWCVKHRYFTVGATIGLFLASVGLFVGGLVKFQGFPEVEADSVELRLALPPGSLVESTEGVVQDAVEALDKVNAAFTPRQPGGESLVKSYTVRYGYNADMGTQEGPHLATVVVDLLPGEQRNGRIDDILETWRDKFGPPTLDVVTNFTDGIGGVAGSPISVRIVGDDLAELKDTSLELQEWFGAFDGAYNLRDDLHEGTPEIRVRMRPGALSANINAATVAQQLYAAHAGQVAQRVQVDVEEFEILVRLSESDTRTIEDLEYFQIHIGNQQHVPLGTIATLTPDRGYSVVTRVDGIRTVTVEGDVIPDVLNVSELMRLFQSEAMPKIVEAHPGVHLSIEGESEESSTTMSSMLSGFIIGIFGIYILLAFQFRSYVEPAIVLVAIPFALIGVIFGNLLMGSPFSLPGLLGFCTLSGIVVNDSILLIETIKLNRKKGLSIPESVTKAGRGRFRAVLLTSVTTMAGLIPLLFESSLQAQVLIPVATSIVFGTFTSTILVLLVLPSMYAVLGDVGLVEKMGESGGHPKKQALSKLPVKTGTAGEPPPARSRGS